MNESLILSRGTKESWSYALPEYVNAIGAVQAIFYGESMTIEFKKWQKIQQFHNIRKEINSVLDYKRTVGEDIKHPVVTYRGKVKLDGTNAAIRIVDGVVAAQSRSRIVTPEDDNYGFAAFVETLKPWLANLAYLPGGDHTIYGEWCGKGIQKRCSVSKCDRMFVVFSMTTAGKKYSDPELILNGLGPLPETVHVLPWYGESITVDYGSQESIDFAVNLMCDYVAHVEKCDPWVESNFGHKGIGEGLVYYPINADYENLPDGIDLMFKAKGEEHKNVIQLKPVISDPEKVANVDAFCDKFVTENRLSQGLTELGITVPSTKDTGAFLKWFGNDVKSESADELEVSGLTWSDVSKKVSTNARNWFFGQL